MGPSFEVVFTEKNTYGSHEQCMRPTEKRGTQLKSAFQHYPNIHFEQSLNNLVGHLINYEACNCYFQLTLEINIYNNI